MSGKSFKLIERDENLTLWQIDTTFKETLDHKTKTI